MSIGNVVFDLGRVLLRWDPQAVAARTSDDPRIQALLHREILAHDDWNRLDRGSLPEADALEGWAARTALPKTLLQELLVQTEETLTPIEESHALLEEVHAAGHALYCLSNMSRRSYAYVRGKYDFWRYFKGIVVSAHVKLLKPEADIYHYLLWRYRLDPERSVFIDDRPENIEAARAVGMHGIVFEDPASCRRQLQALIGGA